MSAMTKAFRMQSYVNEKRHLIYIQQDTNCFWMVGGENGGRRYEAVTHLNSLSQLLHIGIVFKDSLQVWTTPTHLVLKLAIYNWPATKDTHTHTHTTGS